MTTVTFIKDHISGIKAGEVKQLEDSHAARLIEEGHVRVEPPAEAEEDAESEPAEPKTKKGKTK
jgi:hypothetical protein